MAIRIVLAHNDQSYSDRLIAALAAAGLADVAHFSEPMGALDIFFGAKRIELLITRIDFGPSQLHGIALARMARSRRRDTKVILLGEEKHLPHISGEGEFVPLATATDVLAARAYGLLSAPKTS